MNIIVKGWQQNSCRRAPTWCVVAAPVVPRAVRAVPHGATRPAALQRMLQQACPHTPTRLPHAHMDGRMAWSGAASLMSLRPACRKAQLPLVS